MEFRWVGGLRRFLVLKNNVLFENNNVGDHLPTRTPYFYENLENSFCRETDPSMVNTWPQRMATEGRAWAGPGPKAQGRGPHPGPPPRCGPGPGPGLGAALCGHVLTMRAAIFFGCGRSEKYSLA